MLRPGAARPLATATCQQLQPGSPIHRVGRNLALHLNSSFLACHPVKWPVLYTLGQSVTIIVRLDQVCEGGGAHHVVPYLGAGGHLPHGFQLARGRLQQLHSLEEAIVVTVQLSGEGRQV